jgi:hypothetical protein
VSDGFREIDLTDAEQGKVRLLVPLPKDADPWGALAPLRGTPWEAQIQIVSGEAFSHALHGWATPLMREIGPPPHVRADRVPLEAGQCTLHGSCVGSSPFCRPHKKVPECYEPAIEVAARVALAWKEGRYVVVVQGPEFVLI